MRNAILIGTLAAALWSSSYALSNYTQGGYTREMHEKIKTPREQSAEVKAALALVTDDTASVFALVHGASFVVEEAEQSGDLELLMQGLQLYERALAIDNNAKGALLGLADVSFKVGVFDKAAEYYRQVLAGDPADIRARTNMALSLVQLGKSAEAIASLSEQAALEKPDFRVLLTLALAQKEAGDQAAAASTARRALTLAPDEQGKKLLESFLGEQSNSAAAPTTENPIESFVKSHAVLGPKLARVEVEDATVSILLNDFPIEAMPEFAKTSLQAKLKNLLITAGKKRVVLLDAATNAELLVVE